MTSQQSHTTPNHFSRRMIRPTATLTFSLHLPILATAAMMLTGACLPCAAQQTPPQKRVPAANESVDEIERRISTEKAQALEAYLAAHPEVDSVMAAIVGAAGLPACLAAARAGKRLMLANKEALVVGGRLFMAAVQQGGARVVTFNGSFIVDGFGRFMKVLTLIGAFAALLMSGDFLLRAGLNDG